MVKVKPVDGELSGTERIARRVASLKPSGIRKFFDIAATMHDQLTGAEYGLRHSWRCAGILASPEPGSEIRITPDMARDMREEFARVAHNVLSANRLDALIYPSVQVVPPTREERDAGRWTTLTFPTNTLIASQTWMPAVSVVTSMTPWRMAAALSPPPMTVIRASNFSVISTIFAATVIP